MFFFQEEILVLYFLLNPNSNWGWVGKVSLKANVCKWTKGSWLTLIKSNRIKFSLHQIFSEKPGSIPPSKKEFRGWWC